MMPQTTTRRDTEAHDGLPLAQHQRRRVRRETGHCAGGHGVRALALRGGHREGRELRQPRSTKGLTQSDVALAAVVASTRRTRPGPRRNGRRCWHARWRRTRIRLGIVMLRGCPMPLPPLLRTKSYTDARVRRGRRHPRRTRLAEASAEARSGAPDCRRRFICPTIARRISWAAAPTSTRLRRYAHRGAGQCFCSTASRARASPCWR